MTQVRWWLALAGTIAAFGGAAAASALTPVRHVAEADLVVVRGGGPLEPGRLTTRATRTLASLLDSDLIASDVVANLRVRAGAASVRRQLSARAVAPGLLRVRVTDADALRAQQIAQEVTLVFPQLVAARFTGPAAIRSKVWDPAHEAGTTSRGWARGFGIAAVASLLVWLLALALPRVARALAERPRAEEPEPQREPAPEPAPAAEPARFNVAELEELVSRARETYPDRAAEWTAYVFYLRDHASADGALPPRFDPLVQDVFGDLLVPG